MSLEGDEREEQRSADTKRRRIPRWLIWGAAVGAVLGRIGTGIAVSFGIHALRRSSERRRGFSDSDDRKSGRGD